MSEVDPRDPGTLEIRGDACFIDPLRFITSFSASVLLADREGVAVDIRYRWMRRMACSGFLGWGRIATRHLWQEAWGDIRCARIEAGAVVLEDSEGRRVRFEALPRDGLKPVVELLLERGVPTRFLRTTLFDIYLPRVWLR